MTNSSRNWTSRKWLYQGKGYLRRLYLVNQEKATCILTGIQFEEMQGLYSNIDNNIYCQINIPQ